MSGGSYEYLCHKEASDFMDGSAVKYAQEMRDRLVELDALDAAKATEALLLVVAQGRVRIDAAIDALAPVWRAVEWMDSGDVGLEDVQQALAKYRGEK